MRRPFILVIALALALQAGSGIAVADPISDKRAEAEAARERVAEVDRELEIASEDFNEAYAAHQEVTAEVAATQARLAETRDRIGELEGHLDRRAEQMYRSGPYGLVEVLFEAASFRDFASLWDMLTDISEGDAARIADLKEARRQAERDEERLAAAQAEAKARLDEMAAAKAEVEARLSERKSVLAGLEDEVARLEAEEAERRRREAEAAAAAAEQAARARSAPSTSRGSSGSGFTAPAPTRAPRSEVVAIAKRYLGAPYRWAASGPDAFDCSGFTMYVFAQVGVSLPHSSRAQIGYGERVSRADLQPGDLVFFGSGRIHHVGIYVGGGQYIHAPHTGAVVRIDPLDRSDYAGACRP